MRLVHQLFVSTLLLLSLVGPVPASANSIPSFRDLSGHEFGERITTHHEMASYLRTLAETSRRVELIEQGKSWEGRELLLAVVTSGANHSRLDEIQQRAQALGDPRRLSDGEPDAWLGEQPAIVWLGGSIHGFELSGSEGLLKLLEHLATRSDPATMKVLENTVVLIDPMLNPDGRDAFAGFNHQRLGRSSNPRREHWGNAATFWQALRFRTGHYFFDTNRDWFAHTQPETRHRVGQIQAWRPQVMVDAHEMGPDTEFFFDPPALPFGPHFPPFARRWFESFGAAYASAFEEAGFEYTTRELFNYFFPGYTTSYGSYQGAVGMLYEQGSSRGLALERSDGSVRTLQDALEQQYTAAWTAVSLAAKERETLLREYLEAHRKALQIDGGARRYLLPPGGDPGLHRELAALLQRNGIEVARLRDAVTFGDLRDRFGRAVDDLELAAGTWVVEAAQPRQHLLRTLLEPSLPVPKEFLAEARKRLDRGENPRFYDMTSWSLPLLFDLPAFSTGENRTLPVDPWQDAEPTPSDERVETHADSLPYAYLVDGRNAASLGVLNQLRSQGVRVSVLFQGTRLEGREVPSGTVVVRLGSNEIGTDQKIEQACEAFGVECWTTRSARGDDGAPALGTVRGEAAHEVDVALLAEDGIHAYSFGWAWFTLEERFGVSTTVLPTQNLARTPIEAYETLVIPDTRSPEELAAALGEGGKARLHQWLQDGGTLVALGASVEMVRNFEWIALRSANDAEEGEPEVRRFQVPGALVEARTDPEAWLAAGLGEKLPFLLFSSRHYLAPEGPPNGGRRVVVSLPEGELIASGHLWKESRERLPGAVLAYEERVGNGRLIAFAEDLNFRGFWRGSDRLFLNAVLLGPSAP